MALGQEGACAGEVQEPPTAPECRLGRAAVEGKKAWELWQGPGHMTSGQQSMVREEERLPWKRVLEAKRTAGGTEGRRPDGKEGAGAPRVQAGHRPRTTEMRVKERAAVGAAAIQDGPEPR